MSSVASPLWDRTDFIVKHLNEGYWEADLHGKFASELCRIIENSHKEIKKLTMKYKKTAAQRIYAPGHSGTFTVIQTMMEQWENIANHLQTLEQTIKDQTKEFRTQCDALRKELEDHRRDLQREEDNLQKSNQRMQELLSNYQDQYREMLRAQENMRKADENLNLSRKDVLKYQHLSQQRTRDCEVAKAEYTNQVDVFNELQENHYFHWLSEWVNLCREMEQKRCSSYSSCIVSHGESVSVLCSKVQECLSELNSVREKCDPATDWAHFINNVVTGNSPPDAVLVIDLANQSSASLLPSVMSRKASKDSVTSQTATTDSSSLNEASTTVFSKIFRRNVNIVRGPSSISSSSLDKANTVNPSKKLTPVQSSWEEAKDNENVYDDYNAIHTDSSYSSDECKPSQLYRATSSENQGSSVDVQMCTALYHFDADPLHDILGIEMGERFVVTHKYVTTDWHQVRSTDGTRQGIVPASYVTLDENP